MTDKELIKVAKWLNKNGYGIDLKDPFWMEEYKWGEHKTRDIIELMQKYANDHYFIQLPTEEEIEQAANTLCPVKNGIDDGTYNEGKNVGFEIGANFVIEKIKELNKLY